MDIFAEAQYAATRLEVDWQCGPDLLDGEWCAVGNVAGHRVTWYYTAPNQFTMSAIWKRARPEWMVAALNGRDVLREALLKG